MYSFIYNTLIGLCQTISYYNNLNGYGNNQRQGYGDDSVTIWIGPVEVATHTLSTYAPFTKYTWTFMINFPAAISFEGLGGDNVGLLLDNVNLIAIPAPGAILLSTVGAVIVGWLRRCRTL